MERELIVIEDYCTKCNIEPDFVISLNEEGLIEVTVENGKQYIEESQLRDLDRFCRLHYDLDINMEGLDVIQQLLDRIDSLQRQMKALRR